MKALAIGLIALSVFSCAFGVLLIFSFFKPEWHEEGENPAMFLTGLAMLALGVAAIYAVAEDWS